MLQSDVPGEQTAPTQPIPSRPAPYAQQGLKEEDLIDYTPDQGLGAQPGTVPDGSVFHPGGADRRQYAERLQMRVV